MTNPLASLTPHAPATRKLDSSNFLRQRQEDFAAHLARLAEQHRSPDAPDLARGPERIVTTPAPERTRPDSESQPEQPAAPEARQSTGETQPGEQRSDPLPHIPRFADVPLSAQYPLGPYRQAPEEYGGEWWLVNPFTGDEPWAKHPELLGGDAASATEAPTRQLPEGFEEIFGPEPSAADFANRIDFNRVRNEWEHQLEHFGGTGIPEGFTAEDVEAAQATFEAWGLGEPVFYEGRYGWVARFPNGGVPEFQANPATALLTPHLVVAGYQIRLAQQGSDVQEQHPFVPPSVFGDPTPLDPEDFQTA